VYQAIRFRLLAWAALLLAVPGLHSASPLAEGAPGIYSGFYENGAFQSLTFMNSVYGWDTFFYAGFLGSGRVIANVEAGLVWDGHEAFLRPAGSPPAVGMTFAGTGVLAETDYHATMVGQVLAGTGYVTGSDPAQFTYVGIGMAPLAEIWSGAIATSFPKTDKIEDIGSFETTLASTVSVYQKFFQGIPGATPGVIKKPDVINSSWGGGDPAANSAEMLAIDGLARQNPTVALVASAGNGGNAQISAPAANYNSIAVGSLGGASFLVPSSFSSKGAVDFYNPVTGKLLTGVRAAVDIAAAGEDYFLAAYLGPTGSLGASTVPVIVGMLQVPSPTDQYFLNMSGTSFSAPLVSGGIALLKDAAANHPFLNLNATPAANDTRVIKSVLMAGATETTGWDNGQAADAHGVIRTAQALDYATGAGALNLNNAVDIYLLAGTRDVWGTAGGFVSETGWDYGVVTLSGSNDYLIANAFDSPVELTVSLNWFADVSFDDAESVGQSLSFADLNLEVWNVVAGGFSTLAAASASIYNNVEFLRIDLPAGDYGLRVTFSGLIFETVSGSTTEEAYGLAWQSQAIPEPTSIFLIVFAAGLAAIRSRRARHFPDSQTCALKSSREIRLEPTDPGQRFLRVGFG